MEICTQRWATCFFYLEWRPKYLYNMLRQERFKDLLAKVLGEESMKLECMIIEMGIGDNHAHLVIEPRLALSVSCVFHELKVKSAYELLRFELKFRLRYPNGDFWPLENSIGVWVTQISKQDEMC
ncbi:MAG: transposase [Thermoplasmatales archaeon]